MTQQLPFSNPQSTLTGSIAIHQHQRCLPQWAYSWKCSLPSARRGSWWSTPGNAVARVATHEKWKMKDQTKMLSFVAAFVQPYEALVASPKVYKYKNHSRIKHVSKQGPWLLDSFLDWSHRNSPPKPVDQSMLYAIALDIAPEFVPTFSRGWSSQGAA